MQTVANPQSPTPSLPTPGSKHSLVVALVPVVVVLLFVGVLWHRQSAGKLIIKVGETEVHMDVGNTMEVRALIEHLFNDDLRKREMTALLREFYHFYPRDSPDWVYMLHAEPGDTALSTRLRSLLFDLKGPFQRAYHTFYDITNPETVEALVDLGYHHPVAQKLRQLRDNVEGMLQEIGLPVRLAAQPGLGAKSAVVCEGSPYRGRDLLLINPDDPQRTISVVANTTSHCIRVRASDGDEVPRIGISLPDAQQLFGARDVHSEEHALLYPIPRGYAVHPQVVMVSPAEAPRE